MSDPTAESGSTTSTPHHNATASPASRPGSDWLAPEATIGVRKRSTRGRIALVATSAAIFAGGFGVFFATGQQPASSSPLSFFLEEQAQDASGIKFVHEPGAFARFFENVLPFMQAVSASACTADVDRDGDLDVYMTTAGEGKENALFLNETEPRRGRAPAPLEAAPATTSAPAGLRFRRADAPALNGRNGKDGFSSDCVFADVDNDGFPELFLGKIAQRPQLFKNTPGATENERVFVDVTDASGLPDYMNGFAASFFDADKDGDLDLLYASYFGERYLAEDIPERPRVHNFEIPEHENAGRMMPNNWGAATNGGEKHFLLNDGEGVFTAQDLSAWGFEETRFTFDIGTADIDQDGFTDVYFANDFGPDQLYFNVDGKKFVAQVGKVPTEVGRDSFKGMNAELVDIDNDSFPEIYVTNVFHPVLPEGNILWKNMPGDGGARRRTFQNVAADLGAKDGGWGWGAKFVDLDLDGDTDLVETNGYISQSPEREYWYRLSRLVAGDRRLIVDTRKWPKFEDRSMSGHQVSHVFVWDGVRFHNRAADVGVARSFDGRGVLIADFDIDGRPDVMYVAQGKPYFLGRNAFRPTDAQPTPPHWAGFVLEGDGTRVNRDAVGARIEIRPSDTRPMLKPLYREVSAGNGMSAQSMRWIVAGLGEYAGAVDVVVRWTDGTTTERKGLEGGRYHAIAYGERTALDARSAR